MKTEKMLAHDADTSSDRIDTMFGGPIFASEFADAALDVLVASENAVEAPNATKTKTCKPTRNPCCKPPGEEPPAGYQRDALDLLSV